LRRISLLEDVTYFPLNVSSSEFFLSFTRGVYGHSTTIWLCISIDLPAPAVPPFFVESVDS
jgi:hypothetical protein